MQQSYNDFLKGIYIFDVNASQKKLCLITFLTIYFCLILVLAF